MKLDPVFEVKANKLYKLADGKEVAPSSLKLIDIKWSEVELEPESYNEALLADLREQLKPLDDSDTFVILNPIVDKDLKTQDSVELFINAYNHTARRIKDCTCIAGFLLPQALMVYEKGAVSGPNQFIEALAVKHAQYVYFATADDLNKSQMDSKDSIAIYGN